MSQIYIAFVRMRKLLC